MRVVGLSGSLRWLADDEYKWKLIPIIIYVHMQLHICTYSSIQRKYPKQCSEQAKCWWRRWWRRQPAKIANEIKRSKHVNQHLTSPSSHIHALHSKNTPHHTAHTIQILHVNNTTYHQIQVNAMRVAASNTHWSLQKNWNRTEQNRAEQTRPGQNGERHGTVSVDWNRPIG